MNKEQAAPLAQFIRIRQSGLRSINVEQDASQTAVAEGYTLTPQARSTLARMLDRLTDRSAAACAWTLTGPYGSGKSYFSLFLMNLLSSTLPAHEHLTAQLRQSDPLLTEQVGAYAQLTDTKGFLPIPITGYRVSLQDCLLHGFGRAIATLASNDALSSWYEKVQETMTTDDSRQVLAHLQAFSELICSPELGYRGLLLILDEMGKPLEHLANYPESGDIYLLQEIAEFADRSQYPIVFVGILHQGFERYAGHLDMTTQREWAKVQGRFADIAFQEPTHQQMALLARAIDVTQELAGIDELVSNYTQDALENGWKPPLLSNSEFNQLCRQAYPLHPTALVALPHLFRRLAQNERSLYSYLGSLEPFGFQEFLQSYRLADVVRLHNLFDYLVANFQGRLYASMRGRLITETLERLQSAPNLSATAVVLLKTIGLVNWLAEVSDLQPTKQTLMAALRSPALETAAIQAALDELVRQSLIVFRRFNGSYVIWQGSDVDLDERMQVAQNKLQGVLKLASTVEQYLPPRPVVARRHSYRTGFIRSWHMRYVDSLNRDTISSTTQKGFAGTVLLCLPITKAEHDSFIEWSRDALWRDRPDFVIGVAQETARMAQLTQELRSLHWVRENTLELRDDPVARRELRTRINAVEILIRSEIDQTLSAHRLSKGGACRWFYQGNELTDQFGRGLSHLLSSLSDELYGGSPILWNELINRRVLSSQGAAARRNLIEAMWLHEQEPQLGITGFPPERSMYECVLAQSGLHRQSGEGSWVFHSPPADDLPNLRPVWAAIEQWVFGDEPEQRSVAELFDKLSKPPYGMTEGVLPVLLSAFMLANRHETTLYREGTLLPAPGVADWEVLLRRPELFTVAGVRIVGPRTAIVERLAERLEVDTAVLPIVRELIRRLRALPDFAWRTQNLTGTTLALRQVIERAHSPERLLFHELPAALELPSFPANGTTKPAQIGAFFDRLNAALQELARVMARTTERARDELLVACGFATGEKGWQLFQREAAVLLPYINQAKLIPLIKRAAETSDPDAALESVLAYVANRPPRSWSDVNVERFPYQAAELGELFKSERSGYDPMASLSPTQREQGQQIADQLQQYVVKEFDVEMEVRRAALRVVLRELDRMSSTNGHTPGSSQPIPGTTAAKGE
jgi:hypothetical protein